MSAALSPPTEQEYEVFRLVMVVRRSIFDVAVEVRLSPEEIRRIVDRVMEYLMAALAAETPEHRLGRLRVARYLAMERMEYLQTEAQHAWNSEDVQRQTVRSIKVGDGPLTTMISKQSGKDSRFLFASARLNIMSFKFTQEVYEPLCPPEEDCSTVVAKPARATKTKPVDGAVSGFPETACVNDPVGAPPTESSATDPAQLPPRRKLTRKEKRARRQFLQQAS